MYITENCGSRPLCLYFCAESTVWHAFTVPYTGALLGTCAYISTGKNVFIMQDAPNNQTLYMLTYI